MRCLDDCHGYELENFMSWPGINRGHTYQLLHFYEMRENGDKIDGVTNEEVIRVLIHRITELNKRFPCAENEIALVDLGDALSQLDKRTADREARRVEGTHKL